MALLTTRPPQHRRSLRHIPHGARNLRPRSPPAPLHACWTALRQKYIGNTAERHNLVPNGHIFLMPPYITAILSSLGDAVSEDRGLSSGGEDTDDGKNNTERNDQLEGSQDRDRLMGEPVASESVIESTVSSPRADGAFLGIGSQYNATILHPTPGCLSGYPLGATTVPNGASHPSPAPGNRVARATNTPRTAIAGSSKALETQKRRRCPDDGDDEDSKRNRKRRSPGRAGIPQTKLHMCPYQLRPLPTNIHPGNPEVCAKGIKPGRVREHIRRYHLQPAQCPNCGRRGDPGQIKEHRERRKCDQKPDIKGVPQEILYIDNQLTLQPKTTWEEVWVLLFGPDIPLPQETDRYIRIHNPVEELVDAIIGEMGMDIWKGFLRSEGFQRISPNYPWIESIDEKGIGDPQMESLLPIIEGNRKCQDLQTESNTLAAEELGFVPALPNVDIGLNQRIITHEELPQGFTPPEYLGGAWVGDLGGEASWEYGASNDPAVGTGSTEDDAPNDDQASAWVASFSGDF